MKNILRISSNYSKYIKILKISIIVISLILTQIFLALFYGNDMLFNKMESQGVSLTSFYVRNIKGYSLPSNFKEYAMEDTIKNLGILSEEGMHVTDIVILKMMRQMEV